jgi:SAM-dependent methyltransferase
MSNFEYSGRDNLDIMSLAVNYNSSIYKWLSHDTKIGSSVLDFGSGQGEFYYRFNSYCDNVYAVEPDVNMHNLFPSNYIFSKIESLDNKKFDLIYSVNVLEHIEDDVLAVNKFKGYLSTGKGVVKIFVPARQELYSDMDKKVGHYRRYSKKQIKKIFVDGGYTIKSCHYFDFLGYFAAAFYKILGKSGDINPKSLVFYDKYIFPVSLFLDKFFSRFIGKNIVIEAVLKK